MVRTELKELEKFRVELTHRSDMISFTTWADNAKQAESVTKKAYCKKNKLLPNAFIKTSAKCLTKLDTEKPPLYCLVLDSKGDRWEIS